LAKEGPASPHSLHSPARENARQQNTLANAAARAPRLCLGVDVARSRDLTVFWLLETTGGVHFTRDICVLHNQPFSVQEELLWQRLSLPGLRRACLDASGLGRQLAERAVERFGPRRVEPVTFTTAVHEELAYPVRHAFERRAVRIPADKDLRADLRAIKKTATASGNIRFAADRGPHGHADRFWALALALHAARAPLYPDSHYETLPRSPIALSSAPGSAASAAPLEDSTPSLHSPHSAAQQNARKNALAV
jgi:phage FluMu gp28-like protein